MIIKMAEIRTRKVIIAKIMMVIINIIKAVMRIIADRMVNDNNNRNNQNDNGDGYSHNNSNMVVIPMVTIQL